MTSPFIEEARKSILDGNYELLKSLVIRHRISVNSDMVGVLPIHLAAGSPKNSKKLTKLLVKMGSSVNSKTSTGLLTPLHIAVFRKNYEVVQYLLLSGANPYCKDEDGRDAFAYAKKLKDNYCLQLLRDNEVAGDLTELDITESETDTDCGTLAEKLENTLGRTMDVQSVTSEDSFVTAVGGSIPKARMANPLDEFISKYPIEMQFAFQSRFTAQELQCLDNEFMETFKAIGKNGAFGGGKKTTLGMRFTSGKVFFNYFLFDPRIFPQFQHPYSGYDAERITLMDFLKSIFYIGKGLKTRPTQHLEDAKLYLMQNKDNDRDKQPKASASPLQYIMKPPSGGSKKIKASRKIEKVLDIWSTGRGVVALHVFNNQSETEAFTREACCIDAIGLGNLTNMRKGDTRGPICETWPDWKRRKYGAWLILRAFNILRMESPPELLPSDFK